MLFGYCALRGLTKITRGGTIVSFTYDAAGRRTSMTLPNGVLASYSYDAASQLTAITYSKGPSIIGDLTYTHDLGGRVVQKGGSLARTDLPAAMTAAYDAANRLTQFNGRSLTYDANGNLTADGLRSYSWDAANRLSQITGGASANFLYDAFGRRQSKTVGGVQTAYLYDGLNPVQERAGGTAKANLLTGGVDEYFARTDVGGTQSYLTDALGSILALTDATGALTSQYSYEPYGRTTASGAASDNPFQYTGRENDGTGLYYYRARYYSPELARFISEDQIGFAGGPNFYAYTGDDPINFRDPSGNCPWCFGAAVGALLNGGFNLINQLNTNSGPINWGSVGAAAVAGAVTGGSGAWFFSKMSTSVFQNAVFNGVTNRLRIWVVHGLAISSLALASNSQ